MEKLKNSIFEILTISQTLTEFTMGLFGATHGWGGGGGGGEKGPLSKICHTHPTLMKFGTVILYLKRIQKIHKSRDTPFELC